MVIAGISSPTMFFHTNHDDEEEYKNRIFTAVSVCSFFVMKPYEGLSVCFFVCVQVLYSYC